MSARPFRFKGPFNIDIFDGSAPTPVLLYSQEKVTSSDLMVTKADPQIDEDELGVKRVMYHNVECEYTLGEYNPTDIQALNDQVNKVVLTYPNQGKTVTIADVTYSYVSMEGLQPKLIFGLNVLGSDFTAAFQVAAIV